MSPRVAWALAVYTGATWLNGLSRSLGSRRAALAVLAAVGMLLAWWLVYGTIELGRLLQVDDEIVVDLVMPVAGIHAAIPALTTLIAAIYMPERTRVSDVLALLPVRPGEREMAARWLVVGIGLIFGGVWTAPLALQFALGVDPLPAVVVMTLCALIALSGAVGGHLVLDLLELVLVAVLGRRSVMTRGVAGLITALAILALTLQSLPTQGRAPGGLLTPLGAALAWPLLGGSQAGGYALATLALPAVLVSAWILLGRVPAHVIERRPGRLGSWWRSHAPHARSAVGLEGWQLARHPHNAVGLVFLGGVALLSLTIGREAMSGDSGPLIVLLILTLFGTIGVGSYGSTRSHHWLFHMSGRPLAWMAPKLLSVVAIWSTASVVYIAASALTTGRCVWEMLGVLPMSGIELLAGCLVGIVMPISREQSLTSSFTESVAVVVVLSVAIGLQQATASLSLGAYLAICALAGSGLVGAYALTARVHMRETFAGGPQS